MAIAKWIGGALGWIISGNTLGALVGFYIGSLLDIALSNGEDLPFSANKYRVYDEQDHFEDTNSFEGERNSFLLSMLVLSSYIIKADGKIMHSEMEYVRQFLRVNFGVQKQQGPVQFQETIRKSCVEIRFHTSVSQRLQLLNYLVIIAKADGVISPEEVAALKEVALYIGLSMQDVESMLNLESGAEASSSIEDAYKVLGVSPSATDDEVKAAYRKMALKHHPDRVATLGDDIRKAAEKKFQEINDAKERIFKARGL